jgi:[ribosomal protein S5]-alanine N-acetyltransferase
MRLETARLVLRDLDAADWEAVLAYQSSPLYLRYYSWPSRTPDDVQEFTRRLSTLNRDRPRRCYSFAITLPESDRAIGLASLRRKMGDPHQAEIGYELAPEHWGQGLATEAACRLVGLGFGSLALHRITATCVAENAGSARVMAKVGMSLEGRLRENEYFKGRWWDTLLYGVLRHEWGDERCGQPAAAVGAQE